MSRESDCREDVRKLKQYADELERSIDSVQTLCGTDTWKGPKSERFRHEFSGHKKQIKDAVASARAAIDKALKRVEKEEEEKKKPEAGK
jgi:gas vesicle protein